MVAAVSVSVTPGARRCVFNVCLDGLFSQLSQR